VSRLLVDELRTHKNQDAWSAATFAMNAMPHGQAIAITNQGDVSSVALNALRDAAIAGSDPRTGILEWSAPEGSDPTDIEALAQANPNMGRRLEAGDLLGDATTAKKAGGEVLTKFITEVLCVFVKLLDAAIEPAAWTKCLDPTAVGDPDRRVLCVDVAPNNMHATCYAASVMADGRVRIAFIREWEGLGCTDRMRRELPGLVAEHKPQLVGWLPNGPAAALAADWSEKKNFTEIKGDLPSVCMGFTEQVTSGRLVHAGNPLLDKQVETAQKLKRGDVWVFSRKGAGSCDALYAAAGAVHLARTLPPPSGPLRLVLPE
jgi:phage terminase large subunit-like protein